MIRLIKTNLDEEIENLVKATKKEVLFNWALACAKRIMYYYESNYDNDILTTSYNKAMSFFDGKVTITETKKIALEVHLFAKNVAKSDNITSLTARCLAQAIETLQTKSRSLYSTISALVVVRELNKNNAETAIDTERNWQLLKLKELINIDKK